MDSILIFRTSISGKRDVKRVKSVLEQCPQISKWNVDLEDWEKVLRIECKGITPTGILDMLHSVDIQAVELE